PITLNKISARMINGLLIELNCITRIIKINIPAIPNALPIKAVVSARSSCSPVILISTAFGFGKSFSFSWMIWTNSFGLYPFNTLMNVKFVQSQLSKYLRDLLFHDQYSLQSQACHFENQISILPLQESEENQGTFLLH